MQPLTLMTFIHSIQPIWLIGNEEISQ